MLGIFCLVSAVALIALLWEQHRLRKELETLHNRASAAESAAIQASREVRELNTAVDALTEGQFPDRWRSQD